VLDRRSKISSFASLALTAEARKTADNQAAPQWPIRTWRTRGSARDSEHSGAEDDKPDRFVNVISESQKITANSNLP
jgi:hypothetical protein